MELRCPRCKGPLILDPGDRSDPENPIGPALLCDPCRGDYPVRLDFPDLRLEPSPEVSFEEDLALAEKLAAHAVHVSFDELLAYLFELRPAPLPALRKAHLDHFAVEAEQAEAILGRFDPTDRRPYLDVGCGMGQYMATFSVGGREVIGVDSALYQLVLARKFLEEKNSRVQLIAANAEALPFDNARFTAATAIDVLEHVADPRKVVGEIARVLDDGARMVVTTPNRYSLTADPHVGIWGLGFRSHESAVALVKKELGVDYSSIRPFSYGRLCQLLDDDFPGEATIHAPVPGPVEKASFSSGKRLFAEIYSMMPSPLIAPYFLVDAVKNMSV